MDPSGEGSYQSFVLEGSAAGFNEIRFLAREFELIHRSNKEVARGLKWTEGGRLSVERNKTRAMVEAAALELEYPQLLLVNMFPSLYRYLRTEELNGGLQRGGEGMLVGSGTTLYEALALTVEQPTQQRVEEIFSQVNTKTNSIHERRKKIASGQQEVDRVPLLPHQIMAFEPDKRQISGFERANQFFGTNVTIEASPIQTALNLSGRQFQNVMLNRLEPTIFSDNRQLLLSLMGLVEPKGSFIATIGTGRNPQEFDARKNFLDHVAQEFSHAGITEVSKLPRLVGPAKKMYGPEMTGGIIGRKI